MLKPTLAIFALVLSSIAAPAPEFVVERHIVEVYKRQADISQLLQLASLAGVTALPTDPAVLLQLGPVANSLASALPTSSVLSVLLTAAPSGFVSSIVNDPSYASSFENDFSAGKSPAWFNSLPTSVRSYLHTYSGFGGLAGAGAAIKSVTADAKNGTAAAATGSGMTSSSSSSSSSSATQNAAESAASVSSASAAYVAAAAGTQTEGSTATSSRTGTASTAKGDAARPTGGIAAGLAGMIGLLGMAAAFKNINLASGNATHKVCIYAVNPLGTYDHTGQTVLSPGFASATNDIIDGSNPFNANAAPGVGYNNDGLSLGTNNIDASLYPYDNVAAPSFSNGAVQEATVTTNANVNFNGGIRGPMNHGPNGADYYGHTLGNVTAPGISYDQGLSTALSVQYSDGVYPTAYANTSYYPPNNGTAIGMAHGSSGYATNATALGAELTGRTSTVSSNLPASAAGSVGGRYLHYGNSVYPNGYSNVNPYASSNATATAIDMTQGSTGYAINDTAYGAPSTGTAATMSSTFLPSTPAFVGDYYLQHGNGAYPTSYANGSSYPSNTNTPTAIEMAHGSNNHANTSTALTAPSAGTMPTMSSTLSPSTPGSVSEPNGRPRWACTSCTKTFSRQADMVRHARKHTAVLPYQCPVADCRYKGSYRQDKLEQHRRNCH